MKVLNAQEVETIEGHGWLEDILQQIGLGQAYPIISQTSCRAGTVDVICGLL